MIRIPDQPRSELGQAPREVKDKAERTFMDGIRYFLRHPATAAAIFVKAGQSITSSDTLLIIYGTQVFALGDQGITSMAILWAAFGIGAIVGPLLTNRISDGSTRTLRRLIILGFAFIALGWLVWGIAPSLEVLALAVVVRAMGGSVNWTYSSVIIQQQVADEYLGRMFSLDFAGFELVQTLGILVVGFAIDAFGRGGIQAIVFASALAALAPLLIWIYVVRWLEQRESQTSFAGPDLAAGG